MDLIIKTGFEKISHNIQFQPETTPKGKALFSAGHVRCVEEHRINGKSFFIKAQIIRQTSVSLTPYTTILNIDDERKVVSATCTCVYNKSAKCKHIAALIHYVNNFEDFSKTNHEQEWGKPTTRQFVQEKYSKGKYFSEMFPPKSNQKALQCHDIDVGELIESSPLRRILLESNKDKTEKAVRLLMGDMLQTVDEMFQKEIINQIINKFFEKSGKKMIYSSSHVNTKELSNYYKEVISLSKSKIVELCCDTLKQSKCAKWFETRHLRISASKNVHDIKSRVKKTEEKLCLEKLFPKKFDSASLRYGRKNEFHAAAHYENEFGVKVHKVGVIVCEKQPWLCATPDGVVMKCDTILKIVEFKCPSSCEKLPVVNYQEHKCNVNYLKFEGSVVKLKESSIYYTQCQTQLYVTGLKECDLFIYSPVPEGSICISVHRNENFLKKVIPKCETFYFENYLPKLYQMSKNNDCKSMEKSGGNFEGIKFTGVDILNKM